MFRSHGTTLTIRTPKPRTIFWPVRSNFSSKRCQNNDRPNFSTTTSGCMNAWLLSWKTQFWFCQSRALTSSVRTERKIIMNSSVWTKCSVKFFNRSKISVFKKYPYTCGWGLKRVETCVQKGVNRTKTWQRKSVQRAKTGEEVHLQRAQDLPCHVSPL